MTPPNIPTPQQSGIPFTEAIELLRSRVDIVDVVGRHVVLKRQGRNYVGLCPFHNDKHPSFSVSREKNLYKCFSCGEGGDAFAFVMKRDSRTFGEVVEQFADELGITIARSGKSPEARQQERDEKQRILALNDAAQQWFQQQLATTAGASVREYLAKRGLTDTTIAQFGLGLAPPGWENLANTLRNQQQANNEDLLAAGLATQKQSDGGEIANRVYDRFRQRLMIPIRNDRGQVVAFGGRQLDGDDRGPKYLNSPETPVYHKSHVLYGLLPDALRQAQHALVMEGYFDVIAAHQAGFTNSVAVCGTALTEDHVRLLRRFDVERITLCLDADEAGQRATQQALATLKPFPIDVHVLVVPDGKDPADYIQHHGGEAFGQLLANAAIDALAYQCQRALAPLNLTTDTGKASAAEVLAPILGQVANPVRFRQLVTYWAQHIGIYTDDLTLACQPYRPAGQLLTAPTKHRHTNKRSQGSQRQTSGPERVSAPKKALPQAQLAQLETGWLALLFMNKDSYNLMLPRLESCRLDAPFARWCQGFIQQILGSSPTTPPIRESVIARIQQYLDEQLVLTPEDTSMADYHHQFGQLRLLVSDLAEQWAASMEDSGSYLRRLASHIQRLEGQIQATQRLCQLSPLLEQTKQHEHQQTDGAVSELDPSNNEEASELALIELQYAFRDQLRQPQNPIPTQS